MHPATMSLRAWPDFLYPAISMMVSMDSCLAGSMKLQVLTTITSASPGSGVSWRPRSAKCPINTSVSTRFLGQPRLTNPIFTGENCGKVTYRIAGSFGFDAEPPAELVRIEPGDIVESGTRLGVKNECTRRFAELLQAFAEPGIFCEGGCENHWRPWEPCQLCSERRVLPAVGRWQIKCFLISRDGGIQIVNADHDFLDAGPLGGGRFAAGRSPIFARREIVNQEWKESTVGQTDLRCLPIELDAIGALAAGAARVCD